MDSVYNINQDKKYNHNSYHKGMTLIAKSLQDQNDDTSEITMTYEESTNAKLFCSREEELHVLDEMERNPGTKRKVLWKIDLFICTNLFLIAFIEFLDKNALGIAAVYNFREETHLVGTQYSTLASVFYYGYLLGQAFCFFLIPRVKIGKFVSMSLFLWGGTLMCMAAVHSFGEAITVRFFLGFFEASILPCFMIIASIWWTKSEQPLRSVLYFNTMAGILGGIFGHCVGLINTTLSNWKCLFLIYGVVTVTYSLILFFILPDDIETAWFLNRKERQIAYLRIVSNQTGTDSKSSSGVKWSHARESLQDPKYWIIVAFIICQSITNAGITNFNPLIIKGFGFSPLKTTLLASPQAAVALIGGVMVTAICMWVDNIRCLLWFLACLPALAGAIMVNKIDTEKNRGAALAGVYLMGFYNVPWCLMLALVSSNSAGSTKKTFMSISVAAWYAVGNIIGPYFYKNSEAPRYPMGMHAMEASFTIMAFMGLFYWIIAFWQNKRKRSLENLTVDEEVKVLEEENTNDISDMENIHFKYVY